MSQLKNNLNNEVENEKLPVDNLNEEKSSDAPSDDSTKNSAVIKDVDSPNPFEMKVEKPKNDKPKKSVGKIILGILSYIFIDGLSGMALGLFATLIIGTIISQIGSMIGGSVGYYVSAIGSMAKVLTGFGIGVGMAYKLKKAPMVSISAGVAGMIGAFASGVIKQKVFAGAVTTLAGVGEPLGAFIAAFVAIEMGNLVSGKTKVDIIVTPLVGIICGSTVGLLLGPPISQFMNYIGSIINWGAEQQPILMGIIVSALMGMALTLPISSAAIGISLGLSGIAAGAAAVGCCCQMVGFAVMSFKENKWGGLLAQGVGTSMLQMPNIVRHPLIWIPPTLASMILGPIATSLGVVSSKIGSGMGTAGFVGPIETYFAMIANGSAVWYTLLMIGLFLFVLPAVLTWAIGLIFRHFKLIKENDLKLDL